MNEESQPPAPTPAPAPAPAENQIAVNPYQAGAAQPNVGQVNPSELTSDDKLWAMLSHLSSLVGFGVIAPLIIFLVKKDTSEYVAKHAKEALNFQLSILIYSIGITAVSMVLCVTFILIPAVVIFSIIIAIIAGIKANDGEYYQCPLCIRMIT